MIHDDIRSLLEAPPTGEEAPTLDHIEDTLTAGYARALAIEAERWSGRSPMWRRSWATR